MLGMFHILGPVRVNSRDIGSIPRGQRGLLAALLLHPEPLSRDRLVDVMWDSPPISAWPNVRSGIAALRRHLAANGLPDRIVTAFDGYALDVGPDDLDLRHFTRLVDKGTSLLSDGDPVGAVETLSEAAALWRGPFGPDLPDTRWFRARAVALEGERVSATEHLLSASFLAAGDALSVHRVESVLAEHPYRQRLWELLAGIHCRAGDAVSALAVVRRCRAIYSNDLGMDLPPVLHDVEQAALRWKTGVACGVLGRHFGSSYLRVG
ncbi:MAG: AfsR/SARP family transcriptional regulator [Nocardioides sp.]